MHSLQGLYIKTTINVKIKSISYDLTCLTIILTAKDYADHVCQGWRSFREFYYISLESFEVIFYYDDALSS